MNTDKNPMLESQLITVEKLAWIFDVSARTAATWTGGRRRKPRITLFRDGHVVRMMPAAVLEFIMSRTVRADYAAGSYPDGAIAPKLAEEDFERLAQRMERFIQLQVKAQQELTERTERKAA
jgi:hypothetical protein